VGESFATFPGGKGANQAAAAALRGVPTSLCAAAGQDSFGDFLVGELARRDVQLNHLARLHVSTGTAMILVNAEGENQIVIAPGANACLAPAHVELALQAVDPAFVLVQLEVSEAAITAAANSGRRLILNPAPYRPLDAEVLARTFLITPNETEFRQLTGCDPDDPAQLQNGADWLHDQGVQHVCVTLGSRGAWWSDGKGGSAFAAPAVQPIDTTGAGDALSGVLAAELTRGTPIESAIPLAVAAASYSTTRAGAMSSYLTENELFALLS
jgi:ribokinase